MRLCGDYKISVNQALVVDKYPLPKPSDLFPTLAEAKWFTKLDLAQAYTQMELDEQCRQYVAINTVSVFFGTASAIFQRTMDTTLQGILGVLCYLDDVLIVGKTREERISTLDEVLKRLQKEGLSFGTSAEVVYT